MDADIELERTRLMESLEMWEERLEEARRSEVEATRKEAEAKRTIAAAKKSRTDAKKTAQKAMKSVAESKRRLNGFASIGRLPPEILLEVFMHRSADWHTGDSSWVGVTHVCRYWRKIALESARLWAQIYVSDDEEWTELLLERSKWASLDVVISGEDADNELVQRVLDQLCRIRSLEWNAYYPCPHWIIPSSAPDLRSIILDGEDDFAEYGGNPLAVWSFDMPKLAHLEILHTPVLLWKSKLFSSSLTHLTFRRSVTEDHDPRHPVCTVTDVLHTLKNIPSLDELELANVLPPSNFTDPGCNVRFPRLRVLRLAAPAANLLCFLEHVSFPAVIEMSFDFTDDDDLNEGPMTRSLHLIASIVDSSCRPKDPIRPLRSLHFDKMKFEAWYLDHGVECLSERRSGARTCLSPPALIVEASQVHPHSRGIFFQRLCESLPLLDVGSAFLIIDDMAEEQWRAACTSMPHLRELGVTGQYPYHEPFVESLATVLAIPEYEPPYPTEHRLGRHTFPRLEVLQLRDLRLPPPRAPAVGEAPHILYAYTKVLLDRADAGHELFSLLFVDGKEIYRRDIARLQCAVKEVHFNRVEDPPAQDQDEDEQSVDADDELSAPEPAALPNPSLDAYFAMELCPPPPPQVSLAASPAFLLLTADLRACRYLVRLEWLSRILSQHQPSCLTYSRSLTRRCLRGKADCGSLNC